MSQIPPPSSVPSPEQEPPRTLRDKGEINIPGANSMGMFLLIASLSMIFGATIVMFILFRTGILTREVIGPDGMLTRVSVWTPSPVALPRSLWISTVIIVISSFTIQHALRSIRRDNEKGTITGLTITLVIGLVFLGLQAFNWYEVLSQLRGTETRHNFQLSFFYILTATHAAHVIGGLIPMGLTLRKATRGVYSRNFHPGVRYCAVYWHFLDVVWVILFVLMYLT